MFRSKITYICHLRRVNLFVPLRYQIVNRLQN
nr:MAG TPA: hypothetical protein [Caudoviricetes sp.]